MNNFLKTLAVFAVLFVLCGGAFAGPRGHHGPGHFGPHRPAPVVVTRHHHGGHGGPSRGWWNGALVVGATLGVLDIATRALAPEPTVVVQQPAPAPATVVVQQPVVQQPVVQQPVVQPVIYTQPVQQPVVQPVIYTQPVVQPVTPAGVIYR